MSKLDWLRSLVDEVNQKHKNQGHTHPVEHGIETSQDFTGIQLQVEDMPQFNGTSDTHNDKRSVKESEIKEKGIIRPSKMYRHVVVEPASHVTFHESYPTFDKLSDRQLAWYLYWRQQLQKGIYVDTSEGYIFLYVFELLNFAFESSPEKVVDMLLEVYEAYKDRVPRVAATLPSWIGDLYAELGDIQAAEEWYEITSPKQYGTSAFEIYDLSDTVPPFSLWKRLLPEPTSFYKLHQYEIERCLEQAVITLDHIFRETKHKSLLQILLPDKWVIEDARFYDWAVMERVVPSRRKITYSPKYQGKGSTIDLLQSCVRYIENHFRKEYGKKPLKVEDPLLTPMIQKVLDDGYRHFRLLYPKTEEQKSNSKKRRHVAVKATGVDPDRIDLRTAKDHSDIQIDPSRVETLKKESQWVLGAIDALDNEIDSTTGWESDGENHEQQQTQHTESMQDVRKVQDVQEVQVLAHVQPTLDELLQAPIGNGSLEQLQEILDPKELAFMEWFQQQGKSERSLTETRDFIRSLGAMINTVLDSINEKALECLGDIIFEIDEDTVYWITEL